MGSTKFVEKIILRSEFVLVLLSERVICDVCLYLCYYFWSGDGCKHENRDEEGIQTKRGETSKTGRTSHYPTIFAVAGIVSWCWRTPKHHELPINGSSWNLPIPNLAASRATILAHSRIRPLFLLPKSLCLLTLCTFLPKKALLQPAFLKAFEAWQMRLLSRIWGTKCNL